MNVSSKNLHAWLMPAETVSNLKANIFNNQTESISSFTSLLFLQIFFNHILQNNNLYPQNETFSVLDMKVAQNFCCSKDSSSSAEDTGG